MVAEAGSVSLAEPLGPSNAAVAATLRKTDQFVQHRGQRNQFTQRRTKRNRFASWPPNRRPCQPPHLQLPHVRLADLETAVRVHAV